MVVFTRLSTLSKPLIICATAGFLWNKFYTEQINENEKLGAIISQADLLCQAYKEKTGIPGLFYASEEKTRLKTNKISTRLGVSIGVTMDGSTVWRKGFGLADVEQRVPCTPDTVMRIASISKTFTITIAGQLVEKGKLKWDDTIDKHHSDLPKFLYENLPVSITVKQLASHTR